MSVMNVKMNADLVSRIVPFDTGGLLTFDLLTFCILEPYPPKDIELGLSHVTSH